MALVLIGFMGAGKSTLAARLAERRGRAPIDGDALLVEHFGHSVAREFELHGEQAFRAAEEEVMGGLLERVDARDVIALGGGSVLSARVRAALKGHTTALIEVAPEVAWERVHRDDGAERPLARDRDAFEALHAQRRGLYEEVADAHLLWAESSGGAAGEYPVLVGRGLLDGEHLAAAWPFDRVASRPFWVTDANVEKLCSERPGELAGLTRMPSGEPAHVIAVSPGERAKTLATAEYVWSDLAHAGMTRADHLVALGGGVVGDLAGFCAATYQRGVPIVQVPTTLVAQVDSAYGGKTGVDLPEAKNYVGAYHQPAAVLVDPDVLATLPPVELAAGWVEVLKTALIAGGELWERVAAEAPGVVPDERTIRECARVKLAVVAEDERDAGRRQVLNLGHTVGHAIETATGYGRYLHGEAVGLGLLAALRLSGQEQLREQVRELLRERDLPVTLDLDPGAGGTDPGAGGTDPGAGRLDPGAGRIDAGAAGIDAILAALGRDKKRVDANVPFVLLDSPGNVRIGCRVPDGELRAAVKELEAG